MNVVAAPSPGVDLAGQIVGGVVGGALGSIFGPVGTAIGRAVGSRVGKAGARAAAAAIANMMEDANDDAAEETREEDQATTCKDCGDIDCFTPPEGADPEEFARQLKEQQDAINDMSPDEILNNMDRFSSGAGRGAGDAAARRQARDQYRDRRVEEVTRENRAAGMSRGDARTAAEASVAEEMSSLAATHVLDMIAGGDGTISGLGDARVNSSIGSQWRHGRADQLRQNAENAKKAGAEKMDVELEICPEDEGGGAGTSSPSTSGPGSPGSGTGDVPMS